MLKHINAPIPALHQVRPDLSLALEAVVTKALAKDPANRYQTTAEMWAALAGTLDESEARAVSAAPHPPAKPNATRAAPLAETPATGTSVAMATRPLVIRWPTAIIQAAPRSRRNAVFIGLGVFVVLAILASALLLPRMLAQQAEARGQNLLAAGKYQLAADAFSEALQRDAGNVSARLGRAAAYEALSAVDINYIDKALADASQAVTLAPNNAAGYVARARLTLLFGQGSEPDLAAALADVDRAVALTPESAHAHFVRGWALLNFPLAGGAPNPLAALADLQKAVALDAGNSEAQLTLAQALLAAGQPGEALAPASRAAELDSTAAQPYLLRAHIQYALNDYVGAVDDLNKALGLATDPVLQATLLVERGYLHYRLKTPSEADNDLQAALAKDPNNLLARSLPLLLHPALPRLPASQIAQVQAEAPNDPIWQALTGELLAAP